MKIETYTEKELVMRKDVIKNRGAIILEDSRQEIFLGKMDKIILGKILIVSKTESDYEYPYRDKVSKYYIPLFAIKRVIN